MAARHAGEDATVPSHPVGADVVREDDALAVVRVVERPAVGREADPVRELDAAVDFRRRSRAVDPPELTGGAGAGLECARAERADEDPAGGIGREIVEADDALEREQHAAHSVAHVHDVAAGDDHAALGVEREAAHPATLRHHGRAGAIGRETVDAATGHVAEIHVSRRIDAGRLDQSEPRRQELHGMRAP